MSSRETLAYRECAGHRNLSVGGLKIHKMSGSLGKESVNVPEHTLFLVDTNVTTSEVWDGVAMEPHDWSKGDMAFLPARTHLTTSHASLPFDEYVIRIRACDLMNASQHACELTGIDLRYYALPRGDILGISRSIMNLAEANSRYRAVPMLIESLEQALHVALVFSLSEANGKVKQPGVLLSVSRCRRVLDFIEANLSHHLSLASIAKAAAMSPYHFGRTFRSTMGITPVRYVWERRIAMAKAILRNKKIPIAEVALSCGFTTQSHFTTAFRLGTGTTPAEYRRAVI